MRAQYTSKCLSTGGGVFSWTAPYSMCMDHHLVIIIHWKTYWDFRRRAENKLVSASMLVLWGRKFVVIFIRLKRNNVIVSVFKKTAVYKFRRPEYARNTQIKAKVEKSTLFTDIINYISVAIICNELLSDCLFLTSCHLSCRSISRRQMKEFVPPEEKRGWIFSRSIQTLL